MFEEITEWVLRHIQAAYREGWQEAARHFDQHMAVADFRAMSANADVYTALQMKRERGD